MIYFISSGFDGLVKIGTAEDPERRLKELQTGSAERLFLLAAIDANTKDEAALHRVFRQCRVRGEWFRREPVINYLTEVIGLELPTTPLGYEWPGAGDCCPECQDFETVYWPNGIVEEDAAGFQFRYGCESGHEWSTWYSRRMARDGLGAFA